MKLVDQGDAVGYPLRCMACRWCGDTLAKEAPGEPWTDSSGGNQCPQAPNPEDGPMPGHEPGGPVVSKPLPDQPERRTGPVAPPVAPIIPRLP